MEMFLVSRMALRVNKLPTIFPRDPQYPFSLRGLVLQYNRVGFALHLQAECEPVRICDTFGPTGWHHDVEDCNTSDYDRVVFSGLCRNVGRRRTAGVLTKCFRDQ